MIWGFLATLFISWEHLSSVHRWKFNSKVPKARDSSPSPGLTQSGSWRFIKFLSLVIESTLEKSNFRLMEFENHIFFVYTCAMEDYNPATLCSACILSHWWVIGFWTGSRLVWLKKKSYWLKKYSTMNKRLHACLQGINANGIPKLCLLAAPFPTYFLSDAMKWFSASVVSPESTPARPLRNIF